MLSNEERVAAVKERVAQLRRQKRQRRDRVIALASVAASLAVIVGVSFALPGVLEGVSASGYEGYETAASIFSSTAAGYVIVGFLAFLLGACVTILCFKLKAFGKKGGKKGEDDGRVP